MASVPGAALADTTGSSAPSASVESDSLSPPSTTAGSSLESENDASMDDGGTADSDTERVSADEVPDDVVDADERAGPLASPASALDRGAVDGSRGSSSQTEYSGSNSVDEGESAPAVEPTEQDWVAIAAEPDSPTNDASMLSTQSNASAQVRAMEPEASVSESRNSLSRLPSLLTSWLGLNHTARENGPSAPEVAPLMWGAALVRREGEANPPAEANAEATRFKLFGDGTAENPNAGLLFGDGFSWDATTCTGTIACDGGKAGLLGGNGGNGWNGGSGGSAGFFGRGGNGGNGVPGGDGGNGGAGGTFVGSGGKGGDGGPALAAGGIAGNGGIGGRGGLLGTRGQDGKKGAGFPGGVTTHLDVAYGPLPAEKLDVYAPRQSSSAPVVLMVHGGGWVIGDKANPGLVNNKVDHFVSNGKIFVSINYPMLPTHNPDAQADAVAAAISYVQAHAADWGGDPDNIVVMGHSAGAHLVALVSAQRDAYPDLRPWQGTVVLDVDALDLVAKMQDNPSAVFRRAFGNDPEYWQQVSPLAALHQGTEPILIVCSSRRPTCNQAEAFAAVARSFGTTVEVLPKDLTHEQINTELGAPGQYTAEVDDFLNDVHQRGGQEPAT
ncbi:MAG: alpha/beta hydrolase fold domain-containing protein [Mycolicibacterium sp.]|uniref:alpha/beta hydrolase n=1 Tax=Mycolicibacterium sp. TaxID=2320850 RepID=UPI003D0CF3C5